MLGDKLHDFDVDLCSYVRANLRDHLDDRHYREALRKSLPGPLRDYLLEEAGLEPGPHERFLLSHKELQELQCFADEELPSPKKWSPYITLHKRSVYCIPEIRQGLSKQSAEEWAEASNHFSRVLLRKGLLLQEGIAAVAKWLLDLRRFLEAMGVTALVPHPFGAFQTPTSPATPKGAIGAKSSSSETAVVDRLTKNMDRLRRAIVGHEMGVHTPAKVLRAAAGIRATDFSKALRELERKGEYKGFTRKAPTRH